MEEIKHTPGPWLREGTLVYALQHHGWRKGEETFCNRFSAGFQLGPGCSEEELIANATLAQAAPELLEALRGCLNSLEHVQRENHLAVSGSAVREQRIKEAQYAIAKATGTQS